MVKPTHSFQIPNSAWGWISHKETLWSVSKGGCLFLLQSLWKSFTNSVSGWSSGSMVTPFVFFLCLILFGIAASTCFSSKWHTFVWKLIERRCVAFCFGKRKGKCNSGLLCLGKFTWQLYLLVTTSNSSSAPHPSPWKYLMVLILLSCCLCVVFYTKGKTQASMQNRCFHFVPDFLTKKHFLLSVPSPDITTPSSTIVKAPVYLICCELSPGFKGGLYLLGRLLLEHKIWMKL